MSIYSSPESFGLTPFGDVDFGESYEFDMVAVWRDQDGSFVWASDSGCSCPEPFEEQGRQFLKPLTSLAAFTNDATYQGMTEHRSWPDFVRLLERLREAGVPA